MVSKKSGNMVSKATWFQKLRCAEWYSHLFIC